jgi:taurine transport system ATP-binding protein
MAQRQIRQAEERTVIKPEPGGFPQETGGIVTLEQVSLRYQAEAGGVPGVLEGIDLKLHEGEFVCLLGPSGCGKSTLLKLIAGFIPPTEGTVLMDREPVRGPDWQRGVVFQQPPLYPWLTARENVRFGLKMRRVPQEESLRLADEYLAKVGLSDYARSKPYELSGGMKQRVAIARALVNRPRVLLMDEPFGALDALTREEMQLLTRSIWQETRCTILFITHDVDEALFLGTRVLVMSSRPGRIIRELRPGFTAGAADGSSSRTRYSEGFLKLREEVLGLIHGQKKELVP